MECTVICFNEFKYSPPTSLPVASIALTIDTYGSYRSSNLLSLYQLIDHCKLCCLEVESECAIFMSAMLTCQINTCTGKRRSSFFFLHLHTCNTHLSETIDLQPKILHGKTSSIHLQWAFFKIFTHWDRNKSCNCEFMFSLWCQNEMSVGKNS